MRISDRIRNITPSATVALNNRVIAMKRSGINIISYGVGEPDFATPDNVNEAAIKAIHEHKTHYTAVSGIAELREAICAKLKNDNNIEYTPDQISVGTGAKQPLTNTLLALCQEGDEVILPTPCWVSYIELIKLTGATPVLVENKEEEGFDLNLEALEAAITPKTCAVLLNTPNNPTGAVYSEAKLRKLAEICVAHDITIISDEIYEKLVYGEAKHFSVASISEEVKAHTITLNGVSKAYAMTGWRIGYAAGPAEVIKGMNSLQSHVTHAPSSISQWASVEALSGDQSSVEAMRQEFAKRQLFITERLNSMPGVKVPPVDGAFYVFPNVTGLFGKKTAEGKVLENDADVADYLLDEGHIAVVPGSAFEAPGYLRLSYANSMTELDEGMNRMAAAIAKLV